MKKTIALPTTSAQIKNPCGTQYPVNEKRIAFIRQLIESNTLAIVDRIVIYLLYNHGLRISEVLNIDYRQITPNGNVHVKGLKLSQDRIVDCFMFQLELIKLRNVRIDKSFWFSRFYYYRLFKRLGLNSIFGTNTKSSVTHLFRHEKVLELKHSGVSSGTIQRYIGHKSNKSTLRYEQEKKHKSN
jgi:integrase